MTPVLWEAVLATWDEVTAILGQALPSGAASAGAVGEAALVKLRASLHDTLDRLRRTLTPTLNEADVARVLFPLTVHLDEKVLRRLSLPDRLEWPLLQLDVLADDVGGEAFYTRLDHLLRLPISAVPSIVLEVYYFCLADGFRGRFDDDAPIDSYKRAIRKHLPASGAPTPGGDSPATPPPAPTKLRRPRSSAFWYAVTAALVVVIVALPILLSNL